MDELNQNENNVAPDSNSDDKAEEITNEITDDNVTVNNEQSENIIENQNTDENAAPDEKQQKSKTDAFDDINNISIDQNKSENTYTETDYFSESYTDSFHNPPKGTLPPPNFGNGFYNGYNPNMKGYGYTGQNNFNQGMNGYGQNPNGYNPNTNGYNPNINGYGYNGGNNNYNPNMNGFNGGQNNYNPNNNYMAGGYVPPYSQNGNNPYGTSANPYIPKKKKLSNAALAGIIIGIAAVFIIILVILAFASIKKDNSTDYTVSDKSESVTESNDNDDKKETDSNVSVTIPIQEKPSLESKYYEDEETGLLTVEGVAKRVSPSVVDVLVYKDTSLYPYSTGSGIIISEDGYIVTNAHVVADADAGLKVTLDNGDEYSAEIIGQDSRTDIAVLKIDADDLSAADFGDSDELELGEMVVAIGNAGGYSGTLTVGYVSGLDREVKTNSGSDTLNCIQTDAAMSPGVSGGALINMYGQVVGITSSKYKSSELDEGIGFAITTKFATPIIEDIISKGYISGRVRVGITYVAITDEMADAYDVKRGIQIQTIDDSCDIANTNAKAGDIITEINGVEVYSQDTIKTALDGCEPGDTVTAHIFRKGITESENEEFDIEFKLMQDTSLS